MFWKESGARKLKQSLRRRSVKGSQRNNEHARKRSRGSSVRLMRQSGSADVRRQKGGVSKGQHREVWCMAFVWV